MALRRRTMCLLMILIIVLLLCFQLNQQRCPVLYREPYGANSIINLDHIIRKPGLFFRLTRFEINVWINHLFEPLSAKLNYPRGFTQVANLDNVDLYFDRMRSSQLSLAQRLFRFNVIMTVGDFRASAWITDQDVSTIYRDFHHVSEVLLHQLSPTFLYHPHPNSLEYDILKSSGPFSPFENVIYAADVVKFAIQTPSTDHRTFFDGNHWEYNMGMWVACDSDGFIRIAIGPEPGSVNDVTLFASSYYANNLNEIINDGDLILFDGIYYFYGEPFLTPFTEHHGHVITQREQRFNEIQRGSRVIIEHVFGLIKSRFQILYHKYRLRRITLGIIARCAFILHNIIISQQSPM